MVAIGPDTGDVRVLDDDLYAYPMTLDLGTFDTEPFYILPVMLIFSNETIELSKRDGSIDLNTPGHNTTALQQMDQRGGPIQRTNRILLALYRRESAGVGARARARGRERGRERASESAGADESAGEPAGFLSGSLFWPPLVA
jgi:hypothetical protein